MREPHADDPVAPRPPCLRLLACLILLGSLRVSCAASADSHVEIRLIADLDEPRGYCLDIVGHQKRAEPAKGIHAHTCYSYQGRLATDQVFDTGALAEGVLRMPDWGVCLTLVRTEIATRAALEVCDGRDAQRFEFTVTGEIVPRSASGLCLGVRDVAGRAGGGGNPPHLIRALMIAPCASDRAQLQRWRVRSNERP